MRHIKKIAFLLCFCVLVMALASCGVTIHEGLGEGDAMDKSSGTVWYHASTCYEAAELEKKLRDNHIEI